MAQLEMCQAGLLQIEEYLSTHPKEATSPIAYGTHVPKDMIGEFIISDSFEYTESFRVNLGGLGISREILSFTAQRLNEKIEHLKSELEHL